MRKDLRDDPGPPFIVYWPLSGFVYVANTLRGGTGTQKSATGSSRLAVSPSVRSNLISVPWRWGVQCTLLVVCMVVNVCSSTAVEQNAMGSYSDKEKEKIQLEYRNAEKNYCMHRITRTLGPFSELCPSQTKDYQTVCVWGGEYTCKRVCLCVCMWRPEVSSWNLPLGHPHLNLRHSISST